MLGEWTVGEKCLITCSPVCVLVVSLFPVCDSRASLKALWGRKHRMIVPVRLCGCFWSFYLRFYTDYCVWRSWHSLEKLFINIHHLMFSLLKLAQLFKAPFWEGSLHVALWQCYLMALQEMEPSSSGSKQLCDCSISLFPYTKLGSYSWLR